MERLTTVIKFKDLKTNLPKSIEDIKLEILQNFKYLYFSGFLESENQICIDLNNTGSKVIIGKQPLTDGTIYIRYFRANGRVRTANVSTPRAYREEMEFVRNEMIAEARKLLAKVVRDDD